MWVLKTELFMSNSAVSRGSERLRISGDKLPERKHFVHNDSEYRAQSFRH